MRTFRSRRSRRCAAALLGLLIAVLTTSTLPMLRAQSYLTRGDMGDVHQEYGCVVSIPNPCVDHVDCTPLAAVNPPFNSTPVCSSYTSPLPTHFSFVNTDGDWTECRQQGSQESSCDATLEPCQSTRMFINNADGCIPGGIFYCGIREVRAWYITADEACP